LKAEGDFRVAERRRTPKMFLDASAQFAAAAFEIAGNAGLVLTEGTADFGQGLLAGIIKIKAVAVHGWKRSERGFESGDEASEIPLAMRIERKRRNILMRKQIGLFAIAGVERLPAAAIADSINMPLRQDGTEPGLQRTAPVEITEERALTALAVHETKEVGEQRVREFLCVGASVAAFGDSANGGSEVAAILLDKMIPGSLTTFETCGSERQVFRV
jgi:hypothetical protein